MKITEVRGLSYFAVPPPNHPTTRLFQIPVPVTSLSSTHPISFPQSPSSPKVSSLSNTKNGTQMLTPPHRNTQIMRLVCTLYYTRLHHTTYTVPFISSTVVCRPPGCSTQVGTQTRLLRYTPYSCFGVFELCGHISITKIPNFQEGADIVLSDKVPSTYLTYLRK